MMTSILRRLASCIVAIPFCSACHAALTDNLVAYWKCDETGNLIDVHGGNTLTETGGTIGSIAGKVNNARDSQSGKGFRASDATWNSHGNVDFTYTAWVKADSLGTFASIVGKDGPASGNREALLYYEGGGVKRFIFLVSPNGTYNSAITRFADSLGQPNLNTWYFLAAWHDSVANTINIQVNNGTVDSVSYSSGAFDGTGTFNIGCDAATTPGNNWDGAIDEVGFWKDTLEPEERAFLYNNGAGRAYPFAIPQLTRSRLIHSPRIETGEVQ